MTETEVRNEYFGYKSFERDWLSAKTRLGPIVARRRSDQWFEIKVLAEEASPGSEPHDILFAVATAFAFVLGHRLFVRGFEDLLPNRETRYLAAPDVEPTRNCLPMPLGKGSAYLDRVEVLLGQAIDFFLTPEGKQVALHLYVCWNTADDVLSKQLAIASISVEALLRLVPPQSFSDADPGWTPDDRALLEKWLEENKNRLSPRFVNRVNGFMGSLGDKRPKDILWDWQRRGLLGVNDDDIDAWQKTRNPATHGGFSSRPPGPDELQTQFDRFYRVLNLMNRIVLELIGYRGLYVDYARPDWPEIDFPAATFPNS
ncbi:MAG: hypothetical protein HY283_04060 [Nitrospirae bacterium]|nr:hypothetical protein [Nitrospirota bacterium]